MSKEPSLLNQINSKYILRKIFSFAFKDTKSVYKFIKYNKKLMNKLEINIKDSYSFEYEINEYITINEKIYDDINKWKSLYSCISFWCYFYELFLYLIYAILFYTEEKFNEKNPIENYDKKRKIL